MGIYLNPNNEDFRMALDSEIYVDKSMLIGLTNKVIRTEQRFVSVSRPRRFGKSMAANMLTAYYSRGCDSREMFSGLKISKDKEAFEKHLNKYNVIHINMVDFFGQRTVTEMIDYLSRRLLHELKKAFSDVDCFDWEDLNSVLEDIYSEKKVHFIFIIDEWDCIFREHKNDFDSQKIYLDFLRNMLKDKSYVALAYMTGILPIKKYGKHSAINMFTEISMIEAGDYAEFTGFTEEEVKTLCEQYNVSFEETKRWYDGYNLMGTSIYNPRSVVTAMTHKYFSNYWTSTDTYEALKEYIQKNVYGLKDKVTRLIAGEEIEINPSKFQNDMTSINTADDALTLLVHLGYLTFDFYTSKVKIPNSEVAQEFINSIEDGGWEEVMKAIDASENLLNATIACDEEKVAELVEQAHSENTSIIKYNDENSLSCVISLAYYSARRKYAMYREVPAGKGFADIVFVPIEDVAAPALVIELKYNQSAEGAIKQVKNRNYTDFLKGYKGDILLVGINYNKDDPNKKHTCRIEKIKK